MRVGAASLLAGIAVCAAGCGGGGGGGGGNALPAAAKVVPASAPALISVNTDFASPQWRDALALLRKFPDAPRALRQISAQTGHIDFEHDVKPALGPEVDVVWLDFKHGGNDVVGLTQPKDNAKFAALIAKGNSTGTSKAVTAEVDGWTVVADSQSKLDAFRSASFGDKLSGDGAFKDGLSRLDEKAAVRAYVAGEPVQAAFDRGLRRNGSPPRLTRDLARLESISAAGFVEPKGVRVEGALATDPGAKPKTVAPTLAGSLPAGALLYVSTADLAAPARAILNLVARSQPKFETQLHQVETVLGVSLEKDVYPLLSQEEAFALYAAKPFPKIVFVTKAPDEGRARELLAHLLQLVKLSGSLHVTTLSVGGVEVSDLSRPGGKVHAFVAVARGKLIVTTARDTLSTLIEGKGPKLSGDPPYRQARADANVPAQVVGMAYGDLTDGLPFAFDLAQANGSRVPPEARTNTQPLSHALLWAEQDGNRLRLAGFLAIK
jgi:hypothetical protein